MVVSTSKINMRYNEKLNISVPILACSAGAFVDRKTWRVVGQVGWVAGERERVWGRGGSNQFLPHAYSLGDFFLLVPARPEPSQTICLIQDGDHATIIYV